jgi:hypothetical protein
MASFLSTHVPIRPVQTISGNTEQTREIQEAAGQTFRDGTPVQINGSGFIQAWDGATVSRGIAGISRQPGFNLASAGQGYPPAFGEVGFPGATSTYGSVPNQPSAVNIVAGSPFSTGATLLASAVADTIFEGMIDNNTGSSYTASVANVGQEYGLSVDSNGYWYVDLGKSTVGTNTVVTIVGLNPNFYASGSNTTQIPNGLVRFTINLAASQATA